MSLLYVIMKKRFVLLFIILLCLAIPCVAFAHPGRTDGDGGHTDHSTGEYHYHHGYPAHQHYDIDGDGRKDCPYEFDDRTGESSGTSSTGGNAASNSSKTSGEDVGLIVLFIVAAIISLLLSWLICRNETGPRFGWSNQSPIEKIIFVLMNGAVLFPLLALVCEGVVYILTHRKALIAALIVISLITLLVIVFLIIAKRKKYREQAEELSKLKKLYADACSKIEDLESKLHVVATEAEQKEAELAETKRKCAVRLVSIEKRLKILSKFFRSQYGEHWMEVVSGAPEGHFFDTYDIFTKDNSGTPWGKPYTFYIAAGATLDKPVRYHRYSCKYACHENPRNLYSLWCNECIPCKICNPPSDVPDWVKKYHEIDNAMSQLYRMSQNIHDFIR